jgi:hypothetical protein
VLTATQLQEVVVIVDWFPTASCVVVVIYVHSVEDVEVLDSEDFSVSAHDDVFEGLIELEPIGTHCIFLCDTSSKEGLCL